MFSTSVAATRSCTRDNYQKTKRCDEAFAAFISMAERFMRNGGGLMYACRELVDVQETPSPCSTYCPLGL